MDAGLLAGLAQGLNQGLGAYQTTRRQQQQLAGENEDRAARRRLAQMQMQQAGFQEGPDGLLAKTDAQERKDAMGEAERQAGLLKSGYKAEYDPMTKTANLAKLEGFRDLEQENRKLQNQKLRQELAQGPTSKRLPADKVLAVQEGGAVLRNLPDIAQTIEQNEDIFGPVMGRLGGMSPYNEKAQTVDAEMRAQSQTFGRYMEGGVLRKEDEDKYRKMFPQLTDTPAVARNKLAIVERILAKKQGSDIDALGASGYDVGGLKTPGKARELPSAITQGKNKGLIPEALANQGGRVSGGGKVRVQKGGETLLIDPSDLKDAMADGYQQVQ